MTWPDIEQLVPHRGPALWLDRVLAHVDDRTRCRARVPAAHPLTEDGAMPGLAAMEWMAQATAAHSALKGRSGGLAEIGVVAGVSSLEVEVDAVSASAVVEVEVVQVEGEDGAMAVFDGVVQADGAVVARGRVTVVRGAAAVGGAA